MNKNKQLVIEKTAENVRDICNVTDYGFQNIFEAAEKIGYRVIRYPIGSDAFLGFALIKDNDKIIFSNSSQILSREIFTVAHEIGHQRLHLGSENNALIRDDDFSETNENEVEANYFAACLLMPMEKVLKFIRLELNDKQVEIWSGLDIARIQTAFSGSYEMTLIRLKSLELLNNDMLAKLRIEKMEQTTTRLLNAINGNSDLCRSSSAKKVPAEYLEWVIDNYNNKLIPKKRLEIALNFVDLDADDFENSKDEAIDEGSISNMKINRHCLLN